MSTQNNLITSNTGLVDPLSKLNKFKIILPVVGAIALFLISFNPVGALFGAGIGFLAAYLLIQGIAAIKHAKLNMKDYPLPSPITEQLLYEHLSQSLFNPDIQIERTNSAIDFWYKDKTEHILIINEKKQTYSITSRMTTTARKKRGGKSNSATEYRNAVIVVPIINKAVEDTVTALKTALSN